MQTKALIITEGGSKIGFGHITRCISLFQAFKEKGISPELIVNADDTVNGLLKNIKYKIFNWLKKQKEIFAPEEKADIVVIDSYLAEFSFYKKISEIAKIPVYIDDTKRFDYPKGIVVNGDTCAEELGYPKKRSVTYLLGIRYAPLRKEFWNVPKKEIKEDVESIMVTFGGDDISNMTPKVLKILIDKYQALNKKVVIGRGFKNIKEIKKLKDIQTELIYFPNAEEMKNLMLEADIAISAGGQTLYELARVGIPTVAIAVSENQLNSSRKTEFIEYAGWRKDKNILDNIIIKTNALLDKLAREKKSKLCRRTIDGKGAMRIVSQIKERMEEYEP